MGRPTKFRGYTAGFICRAVGMGVSLPAAAVMAGVSTSTIYSWRKQNPAFRDQLAKAKAEAVNKAVQVLNRSTDWRAAAFWLERQCSKEFGPKGAA